MILHDAGLFCNCFITDNRPQRLRDILLNFGSEAFFFIYNYINYSFESSLAS